MTLITYHQIHHHHHDHHADFIATFTILIVLGPLSSTKYGDLPYTLLTVLFALQLRDSDVRGDDDDYDGDGGEFDEFRYFNMITTRALN